MVTVRFVSANLCVNLNASMCLRGPDQTPVPGILLRGDGDRRYVCEVNDIFSSASVSLVPRFSFSPAFPLPVRRAWSIGRSNVFDVSSP